jgi:hypothetical protein
MKFKVSTPLLLLGTLSPLFILFDAVLPVPLPLEVLSGFLGFNLCRASLTYEHGENVARTYLFS